MTRAEALAAQHIARHEAQAIAPALPRIRTLMATRKIDERDIAAARAALGLTKAQLGALLDTDAQNIGRMELDRDAKSYRPPAPRMLRLVRAYLDGYRPRDWPG